MTTSHEWHLIRRPHGAPVDEDFALVEVELPEPGRGRGARAQHVPVGRPLHARPDERQPSPTCRRSRSTGRWTAGPWARWRRRRRRRRHRTGRRGRRHRASTASAGASTPCCPPAGPGRRHRRGSRPGLPRGARHARAAPRTPGCCASASSRRATGSSSPARPARWARSSGQIARLKGGQPGRRQRRRPGEGRAGCSTTPASTGRRLQGRPRSPRALKQAAPEGIDVYFDNVGGDHLEAAIGALRPNGRVGAAAARSRPTTTPSRPRARAT